MNCTKFQDKIVCISFYDNWVFSVDFNERNWFYLGGTYLKVKIWVSILMFTFIDGSHYNKRFQFHKNASSRNK